MRYWEIAVGVYTVPSDIYTTHITRHKTGGSDRLHSTQEGAHCIVIDRW